MVRIGNKMDSVEYTKRPGAYGIIEREEDDKVAIVTNVTNGDWYLLGGGIENGETPLEALKREVMEEAGYSIKNIRYFDEVSSWAEGKKRGPLDITATVYVAEFDKKVAEKIENEEEIYWVKPEEYTDRLFHEYQRYILEKYVKLRGENKC